MLELQCRRRIRDGCPGAPPECGPSDAFPPARVPPIPTQGCIGRMASYRAWETVRDQVNRRDAENAGAAQTAAQVLPADERE